MTTRYDTGQCNSRLLRNIFRYNCGPAIVVTLGLWNRPYSQSSSHLVYPLSRGLLSIPLDRKRIMVVYANNPGKLRLRKSGLGC